MPAPGRLDGPELIDDHERRGIPAPKTVRPEIELARSLRIKPIRRLESRITDGIRETPGIPQQLQVVPLRTAPLLRTFTGACDEAVQRPPLDAPPVGKPAQERGLARTDFPEYPDKEQLTREGKFHKRQ